MVAVIQNTDNEIQVNNKHVYLNSENKWVASEELTTAETEALRIHIKD